MRRATGELEKQARRDEILVQAEALFSAKTFDEIKMTDIASDLGLAKGTLYLYFRSKESLFLSLVDKGLSEAFKRLLLSLLQPTMNISIDAVASASASAMASDIALPRLLATMHSVLERSLPFEEALVFKRRLAGKLEEAGTVLAQLLPPLSPDDGRRFFLYLYAQVIGLVSITDISPFMKRVSAEPGLEVFRLGFEATLKDSLCAVLTGLVESALSK